MMQPVPHSFDASELAGLPVPERDWFLANLIPSGTVTQLNGDGGVGKSLLALQVAVGSVTATDSPIGIPKPGNVLFLSAEDDRDEIHRRLDAIARARGLDLADLEGLRMLSLAGQDAVLASSRPGSSVIVATQRWEELNRAVQQCKPVLVVLDFQADVFAGSEIDRAQVRQFIGLLRGLAISHKLAVVLLAHPSVAGMANGSGFSGSTAWNNSVRSRLYLDRPKAAEGDEPDPDVRVLRTMKANYAAKGDEWRLRWEAGRFVPEMGSTSAGAGVNVDQVFLRLLHLFNRQDRIVSPSSGANYAPLIFASHPDREGLGKAQFRLAMERLLQAGQIEVITIGPPSRPQKQLVVKVAP